MKSDLPKLLVEVRTEELPPLLLWRLADDFPDSLLVALQKAGFAADDACRVKEGRQVKRLATPRRLAALLEGIRAESPSKAVEKRGPQVAACYDKEGAPTQALVGFMHSVGVTCEKNLSRREEKGREYVLWQGERPGAKLKGELAALVEKTLLGLNAPRLMRWGENEFKFIRPVRGLTMLFGSDVISGKVMGINSAGETQGNKLGGKIKITSGADYEKQLSDDGVLVDIDRRQVKIDEMLKEAQVSNKERIDAPQELITEVTAMCESPMVLRGNVDNELMTLPRECVHMCMIKHQRFFPLKMPMDVKETLLPIYLVIVDNPKGNAEKMIRGFDGVLRARLRDVKFYYEEDKKLSLAECIEKLKAVTYHKKLGSQYERMERVIHIAMRLNELTKTKLTEEGLIFEVKTQLAALPTLMVGEYPDLLLDMGRRYFKENRETSDFQKIYHCSAIAYRLERLIGMFGVNEKPSGSKDPHGLRRDADFVVNLLLFQPELKDISVKELLNKTYDVYNKKIQDVRNELYKYLLERCSLSLSDYPPMIVDSLLSQNPEYFGFLYRKFDAIIETFSIIGESYSGLWFTGGSEEEYQSNRDDFLSLQALVIANKRINNIFRKSKINLDSLPALDDSLFEHDEEHALLKSVKTLESEFTAHIEKEKFKEALQTLVKIAAPTDAFFDKVLVNADDEKIRDNRFAFLARLRALLEQFADFSKLTV